MTAKPSVDPVTRAAPKGGGPMLVADSEALYGSLGIVFALIAWLAFLGRLIVYVSVVTVG
jgi:hypothetical protein